LGLRLLTVPINFLGNSIGEVFFQEASSNRQGIPEVLEKLFKYMALLGLPVFCFLALTGEVFFNIILGKDWAEAGVYAQILSLYMFSQFITIPASYLMLIFEKQEFSVYLNIATLTVSGISLIIGGMFGNVYLSLILFSISNSVIYLIYGIGFMKYAGVKIIAIFHVFLKIFIINVPFIVILISIKSLLSYSDLIILILSLTLLVIFYAVLMMSFPELRSVFSLDKKNMVK